MSANAIADKAGRPTLRSFTLVASALMCFLFTLPHSIQALCVMAFGLLVMLSALVLTRIRSRSANVPLYAAFVVSGVVNVVYVIIGAFRGAPNVAIIQSLLIFGIAPFAWLLIGAAVRRSFSEVQIYWFFERTAIFACLSVALFFFLYLTFGPDAARIFIANPNVLIAGGAVSATMYVYASLIFLSGAILSFPDIYRKGVGQLLVPLMLVVAAITSGRSALLLACAIGIVGGLGLRFFIRRDDGDPLPSRAAIRMIVFGTIGVALLLAVVSSLGAIDLVGVIQELGDDILSGGGEERRAQYEYLVMGIEQTRGLGAGHGIGVNFIRDFDYPWRYELFVVSIVYKLGFIAAAVSFAPFAYYLFKVGQAAIGRKLSDLDAVLFMGWVAMAIGSFSNPYPESFIFQGLLYLPVVLFSYPTIERARRVA